MLMIGERSRTIRESKKLSQGENHSSVMHVTASGLFAEGYRGLQWSAKTSLN
jgi:hypothetical protein